MLNTWNHYSLKCTFVDLILNAFYFICVYVHMYIDMWFKKLPLPGGASQQLLVKNQLNCAQHGTVKTTTSSTNTLQLFIPMNEHSRPHSGMCSCRSHAGLGSKNVLSPLSFPERVHEPCYLSPNFQRDLCRRCLTRAIALTSARRDPAVRPRRYHVRSLLNYNYETTNPLIVPPYGLRLDTCHRHMNSHFSGGCLCPSGVLSSSATRLRNWKERRKK